MKTKLQGGTLRRVLRYTKKYRGLLLLSLFFGALTVAATLSIPILFGDAIDTILGAGNVSFSAMLPKLFLAGGLILGCGVLTWAMGIVNNRIVYGVVCDLRNDAFSRMVHLPLSYIDTHAHGAIVSRIVADADQFADGLLMGFSQLFTGVLTIGGTLLFMLLIHPWIAVAVVVLTPLSLFVANFIVKHTYSMFRAQSETRGEQTALVGEMIGNLKTVRAFSYEKEAEARFDEINARLETCSRKATFFSSLTNPGTRFVNSIVYAAVTALGAIFVIGGGLSVGGLSCLLSYAGQYAKPFNEISGVVTELQNSVACAARIFELMDAEPETEPASPATLGEVRGDVTLSDVSFSYDKEKKLIEDLSLAVRHGERVAIVGPTGCGKTTVINLLMRFYDVDGGAIAVDDTDIRTVRRGEVRRNYGMVLQDTWIRAGTVRENIAMGKPDATDEEIVAAARAAHAHGFIRRLANGYDTVLSESGGELSQGEKQLLSIARVMIAPPPMLILDEATSSIDTRTELKISDSFETLMRGKTSFIVAHRLSTIRSADVILVMRDGKIVEQGKHEELLAKGGFYAALYNSQFERS